MDTTTTTTTTLRIHVVHLLVFYALTSLTSCEHFYLVYHINESLPSGYIVGNLTSDLMGDESFKAKYDVPHLSEIQFRTLSNARINITLVPGSGVLQVVGDIDREYLCPTKDLCDISIDIFASLRSDFDIVKVAFYVLDVNDNAPVFAQTVFHKTLLEDTPNGTNVTLPYAEDRDSATYGVTEYQLHHRTDYFRLFIINNSDGSKDVQMRLVRQLDYEREKMINLTLIAFDGGNPRKSGSLDIVIRVADANDHIPAFERTSYAVSTAENVTVGTTLIRLTAIDRDSGVNSQIRYSFAPRTQSEYGTLFHIRNDTGDVIVVGELDYETGPYIEEP